MKYLPNMLTALALATLAACSDKAPSDSNAASTAIATTAQTTAKTTTVPSANTGQSQYSVDIRWTSYGIPHVKADDWGSLGFGFAYASARDGICVIAKDVMVVNGELSRHLGAADGNRENDIFHRLTLDTALLDNFKAAQSVADRQFTAGYVAGYNRYLKDHTDPNQQAGLPASCAGKSWLRAINVDDVAKLNIGVGIRYGVARHQKSISDARPPGQQLSVRAADFAEFDGIGSNAIALGKDVTASGRGMLLGNPHYPWAGASRFHMIHTTIPGEVDVMGVGLLTTARVSIGFNRDVAWTHTVSTALRSTLYQLQLNPRNPLQYRFDGRYRDIERHDISIDVLADDGSIAQESHATYSSHFGPIIVSKELPWNSSAAYAVKDANVNNTQSMATYDALNKARNIDEVEAAISLQGVAFTNTIASDRHGTAFYADISITPNLSSEQLRRCRRQLPGIPKRVVVLDGSQRACEWQRDSRSKMAGLLPADEMPRLRRDDYVTNSNNSYWLSNPHQPLTGFAPGIGPERTARSLRTRAGITLVEALIADRKARPEDLQNMLLAQRNFGAELLLDDVLKLCDSVVNKQADEITRACQALTHWDRRQLNTSTGAQVWTEFWRSARNIDQLYTIAFDADDPVNTPRGINSARPKVATQIHAALVNAQTILDRAGIGLEQPWGDIQYATRNGQRIPIPGGQGWAGMFSMIMANLKKGEGYTPIIHGNSYMQVISWNKDGELDARGLLAYAQSQEADSPHYSDQTELYSQGQWFKFPFTEEEIAADPNLETLHLNQSYK